MFKSLILIIVTIFFLSFSHTSVYAQPPVWTIDLLNKEKKPEKFAERKLGSEKMADKKFTFVRHFFQNNFTRYNYYFNANNKINSVLERAKASQQDDYSKLISYYPYTLENTAAQKTELDSVIYKATSGILLHDLRNDWIDNMYLLMGKAYFLRKDFDSAAATFQFIQYNMFPRKKDEDGSRVIGTSEDATNSRISVANKEKQNIFQKAVAKPPSRNDALVWLTRTLIEQDEIGEAAGLMNTLQNDPNMPKRLEDDLHDMQAYWFFKQHIYDSASVYLEKSLSALENKQDKARAEFLLGQLFEMNRQFDKASTYYNLASTHTTVALLDIYAQLNNAKMRKGNNLQELDKGISNLLSIAKKDNFEPYRDIILYSAGDIAMQKPDTNQAIVFFKKSTQYNETNIVFKNKAFLQLAEIAFNRKEYQTAFNFYDSLQSGDTTLTETLEKIQSRRNSLSKIVEQLKIIVKEDSLQKIAALPLLARESFVKKLSKKLRKEKGLKEEDNSAGGDQMITFSKDSNTPTDLFASSSNKSGEWYFYNAGSKSKGFADFKRKWGTRANADNWRRKAAATTNAPSRQDAAMPLGNMNPDDLDAPATAEDAGKTDAGTKDRNGNILAGTGPDDKGSEITQPEDISYEGLMAGLPLTKEKLDASNNLLAMSQFEMGKLFQEDLEDYAEAVKTYEKSLERFPDSLYDGKLYLGLYYCYTKLGNTERANYYKNLLGSKFSGSQANKIVTNPVAAKPNDKNAAGTKRYQDIYTLFIEGKFEQAVHEKQMADSLYGKNFWSPQLLYIEAVYYVKQKNDSIATTVLTQIGELYPTSPLKIKADRMIEVLGRRAEIEKYLTDLQVTRMADDSVIKTDDRVVMVRNDANLIVSTNTYDSLQALAKKQDYNTIKKDAVQLPVKGSDTLVYAIPPPVVSGPFVFNAETPHKVAMLLDKVDGTYINECKNALTRYAAEYFRSAALVVNKEPIDKDYTLVTFSDFANAAEALQFLYKIKKAAPDEVSWLPASKYSFVLIDGDNLERLKTSKDIAGYKKLLSKQYPGQF